MRFVPEYTHAWLETNPTLEELEKARREVLDAIRNLEMMDDIIYWSIVKRKNEALGSVPEIPAD